MTASTLYPVVTEMRLPPVPRRLTGRTRRKLSELPASPPGTALVFQAGGRFIVFDEHRHLTGSEDFVLGALAVAVVDMRPRLLMADLMLPTLRPSEQFAIRTTFAATVARPDVVVRTGAVDLAEELSRHLRKDPKLAEICAAHTIEQIAKVRLLVENRIAAYYSYRAFKHEGVSIALHLVEVTTPVELQERDRRQRSVQVEHELQQQIDELEHKKNLWQLEYEEERSARQQLLQLQRDNALNELKVKAEELEAERARRYVEGGVTELLAWALAKGQITALEMAELRRGEELRAVQQINELVNRLLGGPNGDLVTVDVQQLVDDLLDRLTGHKQLRADRPLPVTGEARPQTALGAARFDTDDENPPDEDEFLH